MIIELHGGQFENKGAYKMLLTAIDELGKRIPDARFVVDACVGTDEQRRVAGLETLLGRRGWMGRRLFRTHFAIQKLRGRLVTGGSGERGGSLPLSKADALIDLAGFAYSDQWGDRPVRDFASVAQYYRQQGKPVILLPQALGPFERQATRTAFARLAPATTVIYARDGQSLDHAMRASAGRADIQLCPDITIPVSATFREVAADEPIIIVPNMRVVDQGGGDPEVYLNLLARAIEVLRNHGTLKVLIHDAQGADETLARQLLERLASPLEIRTVNDPWALKREISEARLVLASRYHALVAALSCGVPSVALGWSHKYHELMREFDCGQCTFDIASDPDEIVEQALFMVDKDENKRLRAVLRQSAKRKFQTIEKMWDHVAGILKSGKPH